jgi:hypothetical protein
MFSFAAQRRKIAVKLSETCRLCLCNETVFLPLYNSAEILHEKKFTQIVQQSRLVIIIISGVYI